MPEYPLRHRPVRVQVCDGCCCGTDRKHPGVDHAAIRRRLALAAAGAGGSSRTVGCVDECSRSNIVIVRPAGIDADRVWIGGVLDDAVVEELCSWVAMGARTPPSPSLRPHVFDRATAEPAGPTLVEFRLG